MMKHTCYPLCVLIILALVSQVSSADTPTEERSLTDQIGYNLQMTSLAVDFYWKDNGRLPSSTDELVESGFIPDGLTNPVTGDLLDLSAAEIEPGGIRLSCIGDSSAILAFVMANGAENEISLDSSFYTELAVDIRNIRMALYMQWADIALKQYMKEFDEIPAGIDALMENGYWPYEGCKNPFTGEPLEFTSSENGDMSWEFTDQFVRVVAYFIDGTPGLIQVPSETLQGEL